MVNDKKQSTETSGVPYRRRGRPAGKNRVPLSREERRARNAQYERERRNETAEVMSQLMETVGCDPNISNADLLATVISRIQRATRKKSSDDLTELERVNANLEAQIASLQTRLGIDDVSLELSDIENDVSQSYSPQKNANTTKTSCNRKDYNLRNRTNKRKRSERLSSEYVQREKRTKTHSETWSVDSGIELRNHAVSPPEPCIPDNMQNLIKTELLPVETKEIDHDVYPVNVEIQTELYNQIYNSESQSSVTMPGWTLGASTQSMSCMERLTRSLILVPSIRPPQQDLSDMLELKTQPDSTSTQHVEPSCDMNIKNECILPQHDDEQITPGILTDTEKGLLTDWIGEEYLDQSKYYEDLQNQASNYPVDILSGFF